MKIYKKIFDQALLELSSEEYQRDIWLNTNNPRNLIGSFIEAVNNLFDDALVKDAIEKEQVVFDQDVTNALAVLHDATDAVDEFRPEEEIINDPLMEVVRQKAAEVLRLIEDSDGSESTVEIIE